MSVSEFYATFTASVWLRKVDLAISLQTFDFWGKDLVAYLI